MSVATACICARASLTWLRSTVTVLSPLLGGMVWPSMESCWRYHWSRLACSCAVSAPTRVALSCSAWPSSSGIICAFPAHASRLLRVVHACRSRPYTIRFGPSPQAFILSCGSSISIWPSNMPHLQPAERFGILVLTPAQFLAALNKKQDHHPPPRAPPPPQKKPPTGPPR